jgi:hypothetical protein
MPSGETIIYAGLEKKLRLVSVPGPEKSKFRYRYGAGFRGVRSVSQFNAASHSSPVPADYGGESDGA